MPPIRVKFKHAGKVYDDENLVCDTDQPPIEFKKAVYERTGVPLERMKVILLYIIMYMYVESHYSQLHCSIIDAQSFSRALCCVHEP